MATKVSRASSYRHLALIGGAACLVAAAIWSAGRGGAATLAGLSLAPLPRLFLVGSLGLLTCAVLTCSRRREVPVMFRRANPPVGEWPASPGFSGYAESVGKLCRQMEDDGGAVLQLLDNLSTGLSLLDPEMQVLRVNRTFCLLFNLRPESVEGRPLREVLPASFLARWSPRFLRGGLGGGEESAEVPDPASGRVLRMTLAKVRAVKRGPESMALLAEDIAGKRSAPADVSEDLQLSRRILNGVSEAVVLTGPEATIIDLNEPAAEMLGYGRREALGLPLGKLLAPNPDHPSAGAEESDIFTGQWKLDGRIMELPLLRRDNSVFPAELKFVDWGVGGQRRLLISVRDTTDEKQARLLADDRLRVIEMMSRNRPTDAILAEQAQMVERQMPGSRCAVLLRKGDVLRPVTAPGLSPELLEHFDGLPVDIWRVSDSFGKGPEGSVLVSDVAGSQFPSGLYAAAADRGYRTCWATPVFSGEGLLAGVVAVCRPEVGSPTGCDCVQGYLFGTPLTGDELRQQAPRLSLGGPNVIPLRPAQQSSPSLTAVA